jgi:transposase-like protein
VSEHGYWRCVVEALQEVITVCEIAKRLDVDERQVWRWKSGERVPRGLYAVRLHLLHVELCPNRQCRIGHYERTDSNVS